MISDRFVRLRFRRSYAVRMIADYDDDDDDRGEGEVDHVAMVINYEYVEMNMMILNLFVISHI